MSVNQTQPELVGQAPYHVLHWRSPARQRLRHGLALSCALFLALIFLGGSTLPAQEARDREIAMQVADWQFALFSWEIQALGEKIEAAIEQPAKALSATEATQQVRDYLTRAQEIQQNESRINKLYSENKNQATEASKELQKKVDELRQSQNANRPAVEQVIENQIGHELVDAGLQFSGKPMPPVQFTFVEPPKKLVVSPRDRIETRYGEMVAAQMPLGAMQQSENAIRNQFNLSAYITNIGGLGAFPTMVIDRASLAWILNTVAHEWTHNYLAFFPLGLNYFANPDMTTINETVAELVGSEIGDRALRAFYPEDAPPPTPDAAGAATVQPQPTPEKPPEFDFDTEMRATRLAVDQWLAAGNVEEAEKYMEARRLVFVQHGYPLRVLNQAYFAFHGSYGTSAASTSPIGPKLEKLRKLMPDLKTFLSTVRQMNSSAELDAALTQWENKASKQ